VAGLRREELAVLAGVSADYVVRLEQGRAGAPSAQVCAALARALRLTDAEQSHLFRLAGHAVGGGRIGRIVPESVRRLLERLDDRPIAVYDAMWTLLLWNPLWAALTGDPTEQSERERNTLWRSFTGAPGRRVHDPGVPDPFQESIVADLRRTAGRYPDDPQVRDLVRRLREVSERFCELWDSHLIDDHDEFGKVFDHPEVGRLELDCDVLAAHRGDLRIVVYTAPQGSAAEGKLALLAAIGTQQLR
jgi:transcriptional regulator with XRE-family HTH domain